MTETAEVWRPIADFPAYSVSNQGRVMRTLKGGGWTRPGLILKQHLDRGYPRVALCRGRKRRHIMVHRLVCEAFHGPPPTPKHQTAHNDGNRGFAWACNLRWATAAENHADKIAHGTCSRGEAHGLSKLTEDAVRAIRADKRSTRVIAGQYGVSAVLISKVRRRLIWTHV